MATETDKTVKENKFKISKNLYNIVILAMVFIVWAGFTKIEYKHLETKLAIQMGLVQDSNGYWVKPSK